jgi:NAD(P)-dependent dehydrogenase (short-subunit alcohol dehydrogenase family)
MTTPDRLSYKARVAVVTGAGRGIGRAHALLLADRGASVVVNDVGVGVDGREASAGPADAVVAEIRQRGGTAIPDFRDIATEEGAAGLIDVALDTFGSIDVLVHNAGLTQGDPEAIAAVNVGAAWWLTERAWSSMVERAYGRIVLTTSSGGIFGDGTGPGPNPKQAYCTSKAAIIGLAKALAIRGRPAGIRVNVIAPSAHTRLGDLNRGIVNTRPGAPPVTAALDWLVEHAPPELVAAGSAWLMHEDCPVTGRVFNVGAGRVAEIFVGITKGYTAPEGRLEPEDVLAHLREVVDVAGHHVPVDQGDYGQWVRGIVDSALTQRSEQSA